MKKFLPGLLFSGFFSPLFLLAQNPLPEGTLDAPKSAVWDPTTTTWFVSNLGGGYTLAKDGIGWISRFNRQGQLTDARWLDGLDAPTGMAVSEGSLFVVDRGRLLEVDIATAAISKQHDLENSVFLKSVVAASDGTVYLSDATANRIYRMLPGEAPEVWITNPKLESPTGMVLDGDNLIVASSGPMADPETFESKRPGTLLTINLKNREIRNLTDGKPIASFDGITKDGDDFFATDWAGGRLLQISKSGEMQVVLSGLWQIAGLGYCPEFDTLALPILSENRVLFLRLGSLRSKGSVSSD